MDLGVIANNWKFLLVQGLIGFGPFIGGTLRLAIPAIVLGFVLGIFVGLARLAEARWIRVPATAYVEFFRGVPLVMVIFWIWFIIPQLLRLPIPEYGVALTAFVIFEAAYFTASRIRGYVPQRQTLRRVSRSASEILRPDFFTRLMSAVAAMIWPAWQ